MIEKAYLGLIGLVVLCATASLGVAAGGYAIFELLRPAFGPAGAAGLLSLAVLLLLAIILGLLALRGRRGSRATESSAGAKLIQLAREKPLLAAGAIVLAGVVIARNPRLVATAISAFMAGQTTKRS